MQMAVKKIEKCYINTVKLLLELSFAMTALPKLSDNVTIDYNYVALTYAQVNCKMFIGHL